MGAARVALHIERPKVQFHFLPGATPQEFESD